MSGMPAIKRLVGILRKHGGDLAAAARELRVTSSPEELATFYEEVVTDLDRLQEINETLNVLTLLGPEEKGPLLARVTRLRRTLELIRREVVRLN